MAVDNPPAARDLEAAKNEPTSTLDSEVSSDVPPTHPEDQHSGESSGEKEGPPQWVNDAPDGGTAAWLCVLGAWCTSFCSFGWLNSVGVFQDYYETGPLRDYSASTVSWIPSLQIFFMFAMGPVVGKIFDTYGPKPLLIGGTFLHVFGLMMASISTQYYQFLLSQGICSALGVAAVFQPGITCIVGYFDRKRGAAYGILATGSSLGGVIFPIMITNLIREVGYPWAMRAGAFLILGLLIVACFTITSRHPPHPKAMTKEQMAKPFHERGFVIMLCGMFLLTFGIFVPLTYLQVQAIEAGMNVGLAQYVIPILNAGSLFGRISSGIVADKLGKYNVFVVATGMAAIFTFGLWIPAKTDAALIVYAVIFGFFSGAYVSLVGALVAQISPLREIGYRTGLAFLISSVGGLFTGPIAGQILDNAGGWTALKAFAGAFLAAGTVVIMGARVYHTGFKLKAVF